MTVLHTFPDGLTSEDLMRTIAVDFDGVIHSYTSGWTGLEPTDPPEMGARPFIQALLDKGYKVVIFSTRATRDEGRALIRAWLIKWEFPEEQLVVTAVKPAAVAYVDDRAVPYHRVTPETPRAGGFTGALRAIDTLVERTYL